MDARIVDINHKRAFQIILTVVRIFSTVTLYNPYYFVLHAQSIAKLVTDRQTERRHENEFNKKIK